METIYIIDILYTTLIISSCVEFVLASIVRLLSSCSMVHLDLYASFLLKHISWLYLFTNENSSSCQDTLSTSPCTLLVRFRDWNFPCKSQTRQYPNFVEIGINLKHPWWGMTKSCSYDSDVKCTFPCWFHGWHHGSWATLVMNTEMQAPIIHVHGGKIPRSCWGISLAVFTVLLEGEIQW